MKKYLFSLPVEVADFFSAHFSQLRNLEMPVYACTPYAYAGSRTSMYVLVQERELAHTQTRARTCSRGGWGINLVDFLRSVWGLRRASGASSLNFQRPWRPQQTASCSVTLLTWGHTHLATLTYSNWPHGVLTSPSLVLSPLLPDSDPAMEWRSHEVIIWKRKLRY